MVLSNLKVTGCGKVPGEKVLSNSQNLVFFCQAKGERLVVVRYLVKGAEQ